MDLLVDIILFCVMAFMVIGLVTHRRLEKRWDVADWRQLMDWAEGYRDRGRRALAERCFVHAIGRAAQFAPEDPRRAESYAALGGLYFDDSDWERAGSLMAKAVTARRLALGDASGQVASDLKILGEICTHRGNLAEAQRHYLLALSTLDRAGQGNSRLSREVSVALETLKAASEKVSTDSGESV